MQVDTVTFFRQNLAYVLQAKEMSQYTLAATSGISRMHIGRILKGRSPNLTFKLAEKLAKPLGVDVILMLLPPRDFQRAYSNGTNLKKLAASA